MFYLDTSAFLKLFLQEDDAEAMRAWYAVGRDCWSSQLLATETHRAARRSGVDAADVDALLDRVSLIAPTPTTFRRAAMLEPSALRTLDAMHIASAMELVPDVEGVVAYDERVAQGAAAAGLATVAPREKRRS
jgi:predicted nucleic acid-binding protein